MCSLRHLTAKHRDVASVMAELRRLGGLKLTAQFLQLAKTWPVLKAVTGLVRNLVNDEANHDTLVARKAIPRLAAILAMAVKEEQKVAQPFLFLTVHEKYLPVYLES